jgi:hypothetical protein
MIGPFGLDEGDGACEHCALTGTYAAFQAVEISHVAAQICRQASGIPGRS